MGQISILTQTQKIILDALRSEKNLAGKFYFTGGTALAEHYLQHRKSDDLDFFCSEKFDTRETLIAIENWGSKFRFKYQARNIEPVQIYILKFPDGEELKVDFAYYPYPQVAQLTEKSGLRIDSLQDIALNKLLTTTQRIEVKDFVDLFFLLQKFSFWDLKNGVESKFRLEIDPYVFATDLTMVEEFSTLPVMLKPLTLKQLKSFFNNLARELGKKAVI